MTNLTDEQVRAILERIDPKFARDFDYFPSDYYGEALRLLAESQDALGEIAEGQHGYFCAWKPQTNTGICDCHVSIARNARKGGK